ncbi:MAG: hypothetical protein V3U11_13625 [Planctomycetota bacterium]
MNRRLGAVICVLALAALCADARAQQHRRQPAGGRKAPSLHDAYAQLIRRLTTAKPLDVKERIRLLRAFLDLHGPKHPAAHPLLLKVRLRLGRSLLVSFRSTDAILELQQVSDLAKQPEHRDLRGRALYGLAQAQQMLGQVQASRTTLKQLQEEFEDTRYGRLATVLERLHAPAKRARNGSPAPAFGPLLDLRGRSVSHTSLRLKPALLLFWSPDIPDSIKRVERLASAWQGAGGDSRQIVAFAVHPDRARVWAAVKQHKWSVSVVPCGSDFLDPVVLAFGVDGVPTTFLLGPDGMLLGRDQGAREIAELLSRLR